MMATGAGGCRCNANRFIGRVLPELADQVVNRHGRRLAVFEHAGDELAAILATFNGDSLLQRRFEQRGIFLTAQLCGQLVDLRVEEVIAALLAEALDLAVQLGDLALIVFFNGFEVAVLFRQLKRGLSCLLSFGGLLRVDGAQARLDISDLLLHGFGVRHPFNVQHIVAGGACGLIGGLLFWRKGVECFFVNQVFPHVLFLGC
ncbi:hypothetical protein HSE3_gp031 [Klebsiella phage vB_KleS-HSE3]|nr:hypothetical protein HSE3_gp031 [Klebsiella phage vB_KleS-HSE3]